MKNIEHKQWVKGMFFVFFLLACFQNVQLVSISEYAALKPIHLFSLLFLPLLFRKKEVKINRILLVYIAYLVVVSLANLQKFGLHSLLLNYLFGLYIVVLCANCGEVLSQDDWLDIICGAASILMIAVLVKDVIRYEDFVWYFENPDKGHPYVWTFVGGGVNLESTWLGLFAFFFYKSRWKWLYAGTNLLLSFLYGSRCGMIVAGLAVLWLLIPELPKLKIRKYRLAALVLVVVGGVVLWRTGLYDALIGRALHRFLSKGQDLGDIGRMTMWQYAFDTIRSYPLGCGVGNCIKAINEVSGVISWESNLHNVYLQNFIDQGWLGGAAYLVLLLRLFWKGRKELLHDPFLASLFAYSAVALFQFRGGETLAFLILAVYLALRDKDAETENLMWKNLFFHEKGEKSR